MCFTVVVKCVAVPMDDQGELGDVSVFVDHDAQTVGDVLTHVKAGNKAFPKQLQVVAVFKGDQPNLVTHEVRHVDPGVYRQVTVAIAPDQIPIPERLRKAAQSN